MAGATKITAERVQAFVHEYWRVLMDKTPGALEKLYRYDSTVFNPFEHRTESGRVSATRKEREYFEHKITFRAEVTSPVDVFLLSDDVAVATYTFRWEASGMVDTSSAGKQFKKSLRNGRATEVITLDFEGRMCIVHQHHSDIWRDPSI